MNSTPTPAEIARKILEHSPVYLDTETTGLGQTDEVCEISIIDHDGSILMDTLVKPTFPIHPSVSAIHGITNEMVSKAPSFREVMPKLQDVLKNRVLVVYNLDYDTRMLAQSAAAHDEVFFQTNLMSYCAMKIYAAHWGEWSDYRHDYKWQRLGDAMRQQGIRFEGTLHRALADTQVTRLLMQKIAGVNGYV